MENKKHIVKIKLYSEIKEIEVEEDETILISALRQGLEPMYNCKMGVCGTCKAKLISGKVTMEENDALTPEEVEEGFILTCQAYPITDDVFINYDY